MASEKIINKSFLWRSMLADEKTMITEIDIRNALNGSPNSLTQDQRILLVKCIEKHVNICTMLVLKSRTK